MLIKRTLFIVVVLLSIESSAQEWFSNLPQNTSPEDLTLFDYQKAFDNYWAPYNVDGGYYVDSRGEKQKAPGWKLFKRWEYHWESRVNQTTGEFPKTTAIDEYNKWVKENPQINNRSTSGNWQSLGPISSAGGYAGTGRLNCIAFHPTDNNTYWVGSPSGGLWKTTNDGSTWTVLTDDNEVLGVSDIAISANYATDNTMYIATGDKNGGGGFESLGSGAVADNNSVGVLKSTDGGVNWNTTGLTYAVSDGRLVSRLLIDPADNNTIYAGTSLGVYKTTDAGANWTHVYMPASSFEYIIDMEFKPGDSQVIYASSKRYWDDAVIKRSIDGGATWTTIKAFTDQYRVDMAVTPANSDYLYAIVANRSSGLAEIAKYDASTSTWTTVYTGGTDNALLGYYSDASGANEGQGSYDLAIAVSPTDADFVIIGGVISHKSTDGGSTWSCSNCWSAHSSYNKGSHPVVHADKHMLKYRSNGDLFECNDGGVYLSTDNGTTWTDKSSGLIHSQLYRIGVSQTDPVATITGLQDNGSKLYNSAATWEDVKGGDGMECAIDYAVYNTQYATYTNGQIDRTDDAWATKTSIEPSGGYPGAWVTPYSLDPVANQTIYAGYADVWKSTDKGANWTQISTTINADDKLRSLAVAPSNSSFIYVADKNQLWMTSNGGTSWTERTAGLPVSTNAITYLAVKNDDPNTVWVTFGGYDGDRVYQSVDAGVTWTNISTGLPNIPIMSIVQNKQNTTDVELYIGADIGVYLNVGLTSWQGFSTGLPNVSMTELDIYYDNTTPANSRLRAGTYGRGLWESDLVTHTPMVYSSSNTTQNNTTGVDKSSTDQEIIGIEIVTTGISSPLDVTQFNLNTNGSTNAINDIGTAKIYYTGTSSVFSSTNQFGVDFANPTGAFAINGTQTLAFGTNYFWLVYDINASAIAGNFVDGECTSITVDGNVRIPTITAPTGNREINPCTYCAVSANSDDQTGLTNVNFNTIDNGSSGDPVYTDYTTVSANVTKGNSYILTVNVNTGGAYTVSAKAWIDWNQDCDFDDIGEEYDLGTTTNVTDGPTSITPSITIPTGALLTNTVMRVRAAYSSGGSYPPVCGNASWSEAEDYTINVVGGGCSASSPIPSSTGLYSSTQSFTDGGFKYYCDANGNLLLGIDATSNVPDNAVSINLNTNDAVYYSMGNGFITANPGAGLLPSTWDANATISSNTTVRYFMPSNALTMVNNVIPGSGDDLTSISQFSFYKVTNSAKAAHEAIANLTSADVQIITNGGNSTSLWQEGTYGGKTYAEFMVSAFSGGGGGGGANGQPLPVELLSFNAIQIDDNVELTWTTASESQSDYFEIERSNNGYTWRVIDKVDALGTNNSKTVYNQIDNKPLSGNNYYRLKEVDFNRSVTYSNIRMVNFEKDILEIFPNPVTDQLHIKYSKDIDADIAVFNMLGTQVLSLSQSLSDPISTSDLTSGVYTIIVSINDTDHIHRIVKK